MLNIGAFTKTEKQRENRVQWKQSARPSKTECQSFLQNRAKTEENRVPDLQGKQSARPSGKTECQTFLDTREKQIARPFWTHENRVPDLSKNRLPDLSGHTRKTECQIFLDTRADLPATCTGQTFLPRPSCPTSNAATFSSLYHNDEASPSENFQTFLRDNKINSFHRKWIFIFTILSHGRIE